MEITRLQTNSRLAGAVISNGFIFLSGQVPTTLDDDITIQTEEVLQKIDALLEQANSNKSHIVSAQIWLKNIDRDFTEFNRLWEAWLQPCPVPARAAIQADMAKPQVLVEIMVVAVHK